MTYSFVYMDGWMDLYTLEVKRVTEDMYRKLGTDQYFRQFSRHPRAVGGSRKKHFLVEKRV